MISDTSQACIPTLHPHLTMQHHFNLEFLYKSSLIAKTRSSSLDRAIIDSVVQPHLGIPSIIPYWAWGLYTALPQTCPSSSLHIDHHQLLWLILLFYNTSPIMANTKLLILLCLVLVLLFATPTHAFGAGNIASISRIEGKNWRHGDIEDVLKTVNCLNKHKWTSMMIKVKLLHTL